MRVLVTGAGGQVGRELVESFRDHSVIGVDHAQLDVAQREDVLATVMSIHPEVIVHAAAWTAVDACESDRDRAFSVNGLGTRHVAEAARRVGAHVCYLSTDYVFDGKQPDPYTEWDRTNPQSAYGASKLAGEHEIAANPDATVVRLSWVCGRYGQNMVKTVLRLANEHDKLQFVDDQFGHPTFADDAAAMIRRLMSDRRPGLFHVTNQGAVSWYEFAQAVLKSAGQDPARVEPIATRDLHPPRPAPRPANSVLDNAALRLSGIPLLPHYEEPLDRLVAELVGG